MTDLVARLLLQADSREVVTEANKASTAVRGVGEASGTADKEMRQAAQGATELARAERELGAAQATGVVVLGRSAAAHAAVAGAARLQSYEMVNLGRQLGDVATMAALGANPLTILATQGFQVAEIFGVAKNRGVGFSEALKQITGQTLSAVRAFGPAALAIGAVGGAAWATVDAFSSLTEVTDDNERAIRANEEATEAYVKAAQAAHSATGDLRRELELDAEAARQNALAKRELAVENLNAARSQLALMRSAPELIARNFANDPEAALTAGIATGLAEGKAKAQVDELTKSIREQDLALQKLEQSLTRSGRASLENLRQSNAEFGKSRGEVILMKAAVEAAKPENAAFAGQLLEAARAAAAHADSEDARKAALTGGRAATRAAAEAQREANEAYRAFAAIQTQLRRLAAQELQDGQRVERQLAERSREGVNFLRGLENQIVREKDRAWAIREGAEAEAHLAREMFVREQLMERGVQLSLDQTGAARALAEQLHALAAATELAALDKRAEDELKAVRLTVREREIEHRVLERKRLLMQQFADLSDEEAEARARAVALQEQANVDAAYAVGRLKEDLRAAWVEGGRLGVDELADYVETRLREAIWEAWLKEPIDIIVNAVIGNADQLVGQIMGASGATGGLSGLLNMGMAGTTLGGLAGSAGMGAIMASMLGVKGSGNGLIDAGASLGGAALGGMAGGMLTSGASTTAMLAGSAGAVGGSSALIGAMAGPIGAVLGLALAGLLSGDGKPNRDYARTDIGLVGGQFTALGSEAEGGGDAGETAKIASAVAQGLNAAGAAFGLDLAKAGGLQTSVGFVSGKKLGAFSPGYFGGAGGGYATGSSVEGAGSAEALVVAVVKDTLLRAIDAGAGSFSEAERRLIETATDLDVAAAQITAGRSISDAIDRAMLELTDPAAFAKQEALDAVEASYQALKTQAETLVAAGLADAEILGRLETLRDLGIAEVLERFSTAVETATEVLEELDPMAGHRLGMSVEDQILAITNPDILKRMNITRDIDRQKADALPLIAAGLLDPGVLDRLETLKTLRLDQTFATLGEAVTDAIDVFAEIRPELESWLARFDQSGFAELNPSEQRGSAMASYERLLEKARAGDPDALAQITGAADDLLSADRTATSSSTQRRALADKVKGDISGLVGLSTAAPAVSVQGAIEVANLPALTTAVADGATNQAQALTTGLDKLEVRLGALQTAFVAAVEVLTGETVSGFDEVAGALASGLAGVAAEAGASREAMDATMQYVRGKAS